MTNRPPGIASVNPQSFNGWGRRQGTEHIRPTQRQEQIVCDRPNEIRPRLMVARHIRDRYLIWRTEIEWRGETHHVIGEQRHHYNQCGHQHGQARATYATWRRRAHARQKRTRHHVTVWQSHESAARTTETRRTPPPQTTDDNPHSQQCTPSRQPNEAATTIRPHSPCHPRQRWPRTDVRPPTTATSPTCSTTKTLRLYRIEIRPIPQIRSIRRQQHKHAQHADRSHRNMRTHTLDHTNRQQAHVTPKKPNISNGTAAPDGIIRPPSTHNDVTARYGTNNSNAGTTPKYEYQRPLKNA